MLKTKDSSLRLKRIQNQDGKYAYTLTAKTLPTFLFNHDVCIRDVIGKFLHDRGRQIVSFEQPADASILHYRFELDNGHMNDSQLEKKLVEHYTKTNVQVVFIMRHREAPQLEAKRLEKIFHISEKIFEDKPNKVLGACYSEFLDNGKIYNRKGKEM
jgi:cystathionine beta-lyase family protein involved in aluminum resistance